MMNEPIYERTAASFHRRIDAIASAVDLMAPGLETAASLFTQALLEDRKILVCGCAEDATLAAHVAAVLRTPQEPGPSLPALAFSSSSPSGDTELWRDLRTLSRDGDVLLCLDSHPGAALAKSCITFAQKRNLTAITLSENTGIENIACIALQAEEQVLRSELILMASHCLKEQVKQVLVGE